MKVFVKRISITVALWVVFVLALTGAGAFMFVGEGHHRQTCPFGESMQKGCGSLALLHATHWSEFLSSFLTSVFFLISICAVASTAFSHILILIEKERRRYYVQSKRRHPQPLTTLLFSSGILNAKIP